MGRMSRAAVALALAALTAALTTTPAAADVVDDNLAAASRGPEDMYVFARASDGATLDRERLERLGVARWHGDLCALGGLAPRAAQLL
jgi:hypothetical protein